MVVGVLRVNLAIFDAVSLKDKRRVIKSLKDRLANKYNVSVAEVSDLETPKRSGIGVAMVSNDGRFVESCLHKIVDVIGTDRNAALLDYEIEWY